MYLYLPVDILELRWSASVHRWTRWVERMRGSHVGGEGLEAKPTHLIPGTSACSSSLSHRPLRKSRNNPPGAGNSFQARNLRPHGDDDVITIIYFFSIFFFSVQFGVES